MKKTLVTMMLAFILVFGLNMTMPVSAQTTTQDEEIVVKKSDLTPDQLQKIKARQVEEKILSLGKYAGMGKEIGTGIREGLTAVKDVSVDFADTKLGKYTMFLIAYKIIGKDIIRFIVGAVFLVLFSVFFAWSYYKNCIVRRILKSDDGKGNKVWVTTDPSSDEKIGHWVALAIFVLIESCIFFA